MASSLSIGFELAAERYLTGNGLLKLTLSGNKLMAECGHNAILTILEHVISPKLLLRIADEIRTKNSLLRTRCANYLSVILINYPTKLLEKYCTNIEEMIRIAVNDASSETRAIGRECFILYEQAFPSKANTLFNTFLLAVQKAVNETRVSKKELLVRTPKDSINTSFGSKTVYSPRNSKVKTENTRAASLRRKITKEPLVKPLRATPSKANPVKKVKAARRVGVREHGGMELSTPEKYPQSGFEKQKSCFDRWSENEEDVQVSLGDLVKQAKGTSAEEKRIAVEAIGKFLQTDERDINSNELKAAINILIEETANTNYKVLY
jgi:hypothetical protein